MNYASFKSFPSFQRDSVESFGRQWARHVTQAIETALRDAITEEEGYLPPLGDIALLGLRIVHPDGRTDYTWRGEVILSVHRPMVDSKGILSVPIYRKAGKQSL